MTSIDARLRTVRTSVEDNRRHGNTERNAQLTLIGDVGSNSNSMSIIMTADTIEEMFGLEKLKSGEYVTITIEKATIQEE